MVSEFDTYRLVYASCAHGQLADNFALDVAPREALLSLIVRLLNFRAFHRTGACNGLADMIARLSIDFELADYRTGRTE